MPRNTGGTYSPPSGAFVTGTVIRSDVMNSKLADLGTEMTDSLSRTGNGDMLAPLRLDDGSAAIPSLSFTTDQEIGLYLSAVNDLRMVSQATNLQKWATTGVTIYPAATLSSTLAVTGNTTVGGTLGVTGAATVGAATVGGTLGVTGNTTVGGTLGVTGALSLSAGLTSSAGGLASTGAAVDASGTIMPTKYILASAAIPTTSGATYPLASLAKTAVGGNTAALNTVVNATTTVTDWTHARYGMSLDVDGVRGAGGQLWFSLAGLQVTAGTTSSSGTPANALALTNGNLSLDGVAAPTSTVAVKNTLTPSNFVKAWAYITTGAGATISGGFSVTSVGAVSTNNLRLTFAQAFANTNYVLTLLTNLTSGGVPVSLNFTNQTNTTIDISAVKASDGATVNLNSVVGAIHIVAFGLQ